MKARWTVALSMLVGIAVGAAAIQTLHAQAKPPVYMIWYTLPTRSPDPFCQSNA